MVCRGQDRVEALQLTGVRLESDRQQLHANLNDTEHQLTRTESQLTQTEDQLTRAQLNKQSLEGDVERLSLVVSDKAAENQLLSSHAETWRRQAAELETQHKTQVVIVPDSGFSSLKYKIESAVYFRRNSIQRCVRISNILV